MPVQVTPKVEASLIEIFSSIQGEGMLVGTRQIFIRFADCNLNCRYCDTEFLPRDYCSIEDFPGSGQFSFTSNPVTLGSILTLIRDWKNLTPKAHHSISLTGGEPLMQIETLQSWIPELRQILPIYLETNGTLPTYLEKILPHLDWVAMDIKLKSVSGQETDWKNHRSFLQLANKTNCYVKIVVGNETSDMELRLAAELVEEISSEIPLVLQPETRNGKIQLSTGSLLKMQATVAATHDNVRVIPQTHRFMGLL